MDAGGLLFAECTGNRRDRHTFTRLIKEHVLPSVIILTDKWKEYNSLNNHGYTHLTVKHRRGFVDPLIGVHTNICKGMWFHVKKQMRQGTGRSRTNSSCLSVALGEFMWMKKKQLTREEG